MKSLKSFRQLERITGSSTTAVDGKQYGVVITGPLCQHSYLSAQNLVGNSLLEDLGNLLDVLDGSARGTLIENNQHLCFEPSLSWAQKNASRIEYNLQHVC
jgi:hypothetical protein